MIYYAFSVLESIFIIAAAAILILVAFLTKLEKMGKKPGNILIFICGILLLVAPTGYLIGAPFSDSDFYEMYTISFGIVGLFIAGGLALFTPFSEKLFERIGAAG